MSKANNNHSPGDGSTGPKTPEGRERSSRNAVTHGARSEKHAILPGESEQEFETLKQSWLAEFKPKTPLEFRVVNRVIERDWAYQRCERLCANAEEKLFLNNPDLTSWSEEEHRNYQRFQRYRTAAHRSYKAALADVENLRANRLKELLLEQQLRRAVHHNLVIGALTKEDLEDDDSGAGNHNPAAPERDESSPKWPIIPS